MSTLFMVLGAGCCWMMAIGCLLAVVLSVMIGVCGVKEYRRTRDRLDIWLGFLAFLFAAIMIVATIGFALLGSRVFPG